MRLTPTKTSQGNFFEDFAVGQVLQHATPRTLTVGDAALYQALYGNRFAVQSSAPFAQSINLHQRAAQGFVAPLDDLLVFHTAFGKTVPDISLNAIANLGYAECRFLRPVYPDDTIVADSEVIGIKETSSGDSGIVYVRTRATVSGEPVLTYVRWVMVRKRDKASPAPKPIVPKLLDRVAPEDFGQGLQFERLNANGYDFTRAGSQHRFGDYQVGEKIDHVDGTTIEEAEHQMATRLYQNTAKVHFDAHAAIGTRFGKRLIYGGVVISIARALTFNGVGNAFHIAAINGGRHVAPLFAGDTVYAWSEVLEAVVVPGNASVGALRLRTVATKNLPCTAFPHKAGDAYADGVILDLDYWVSLPT